MLLLFTRLFFQWFPIEWTFYSSFHISILIRIFASWWIWCLHTWLITHQICRYISATCLLCDAMFTIFLKIINIILIILFSSTCLLCGRMFLIFTLKKLFFHFRIFLRKRFLNRNFLNFAASFFCKLFFKHLLKSFGPFITYRNWNIIDWIFQRFLIYKFFWWTTVSYLLFSNFWSSRSLTKYFRNICSFL